MNLRTIAQITFAFSVCFVSVVLLLWHELAVRVFTQREFDVAVATWVVGSSIIFLVSVSALGGKASRIAPDTVSAPLDPALRKQRLRSIRVLKVIMAILFLELLTGLLGMRSSTVWPSVVGITMNLLVTAVLIRAVIRLQKALR